jgi:hypothetical protein
MAKAKTATKAAPKAKASRGGKAAAKSIAPRGKRERYSAHPSLGMEERAKARLSEATGRSFEDWVGAARKRGFSNMREAADWLEGQHEAIRGMTANWIGYAATMAHADYEDPEPLVDALYAGSHEALRPLHERVVDEMLALGSDVIVTACKTMVPVYRTHVFAEMRPVEGAVEVELALGDVRPAGRLERASNRMPGDRLTHRVRVRAPADLDAQFRGWLGAAYENGAGKMARSTEFEMPADFSKALKAGKKASATWETMTPAMRRDMVQWVTSAKGDDTRARRLGTCLQKLAAGKKRVY